MIKSVLLKIGRFAWRITPWAPLRKFGYATLLRVLRGRRQVATAHGIAFDLDLSESIDAAIFLEGYEKDVRAAIDRHCVRGASVLDVGANVGAHALYLAKKVGSSGRVYAFEPAPYGFSKLTRNIALNDLHNIEALNLALSDRDFEKTVTLRSSWRTDGKRLEERSLVRFVTMDRWCASERVDRIDLIKLDVDGGEFAVLLGGAQIIAHQHPKIILEVGAWHFERESTNPLTFLRRLGYGFEDAGTGARFSDIECIRTRLPRSDPQMTFSINVVAQRS